MTQLHSDTVRSVDPSPSDTSVHTDGRRDWRRDALLIGGVVFAVGNLLHPLEHNDAAYHSATWTAAHLTIFASLPLLVLGLPALLALLETRVRRSIATVAVVASMVGLIGIAPGTVIEAFVAPMVGHQAMEDLEAGGLGVLNGILGSAYLGGTIALGWTLRRAQLQPRWAGPALIATAVVLLGVMSASGPAAGIVIIGATIVYGLALSALALKASDAG
jgi:hypothetical protein